jgi:hypothetical protein
MALPSARSSIIGRGDGVASDIEDVASRFVEESVGYAALYPSPLTRSPHGEVKDGI